MSLDNIMTKADLNVLSDEIKNYVSDRVGGEYTDYTKLLNLPTLGTASTKDVATSGDASANQVVMGNDTRLTDARPASDVSAWAKASIKPTYTASEVGAYTKTESDNKYVAKETGKGLSTNDYTTADKNKLAGISEGATQIIANPADTATETLSKIEVGGVVYDIPQGASGATELSELTDVNLSDVADGQILKYDSATSKFVNADESEGGGGSNVTPNPQGQPTDTLTKIGIGETTQTYYTENSQLCSTEGVYVTSNLDTTLVNGDYTLHIIDGQTEFDKNFTYAGNTVTLNLTHNYDTYDIEITSTTAGMTYGNGAWRNIYCDIYSESSEQTIYDLGTSADKISYDNTTSGLNTDDVQGAIDELADEKVDKVNGKGLSTNDYTDTEKQKLSGIEAEANKTVVDSAMSDSSTNPLQNKVITKELEGAKTTTGNPLTVTDAAPVNAVNLSMDLEPIQDLHGYDHPWVGGAGKNKLNLADINVTNNGSTINIEDGVLKLTGKQTDSGNWMRYKIGEITTTSEMLFSCGTPNNNWNNGFVLYVIVNGVEVTATQTGVTVPAGTYDVRVSIRYNYEINETLYPMFRATTETDSSFAPYENICPISGRGEVAIQRVGKNLVEDTLVGTRLYSSGAIGADSYFSMQLVRVIQGLQYTVTVDDDYLTGGFFTSKPAVGSVTYDGTIIDITNKTFIAPITGWFGFRSLVGDTTTQCELGSTATTYEPYAGKTYTIQLGDTIYGGELDVLSGELRVTHGYVELDGSNDEAWSSELTVNNVYRKKMNVPSNMKLPSSNDTAINALSNQYVCKSANATYLNQTGFSVQSDGTFFAVYDSQFYTSDTSLWTTYLASNPLQIVYELATPYTIDLAPQQIKLLENTNTVYTDYEGDTITIEYQPNNVIGEAVRVVEESYDAELEYLKPTGSISSGDTKAVTGGVVYDYHNTTPLNPNADLYIEKSGNVINIEARDVDGSAFTSYPGAGGYTLPTGYRPKRILIVCVYVYTTYDNKRHHGIIKIRDDGTMDGYFIDFSGNEHRIYDSSYSSEVSFNTSYIV